MVSVDLRAIAIAWRIKETGTATTATVTSTTAMDRFTDSMTSNYSDSILEVLEDLTDSFLITDPSISGHPIVFASRGFLAMTGYSKEEVVGKNGRIFQGPRTDRQSVMEVREAIREERGVELSLLNYRKDGSPHWILFHLCPIIEDRRVIHFLAVQVPIARPSRKEVVFGSCRNEVRSELGFRCEVDSFEDTDSRGVGAEEFREVSEWEKQKAADAAKNIVSILKYYREHVDRVLCGRRCSENIAPLSSSLVSSFSRIKQSFVLMDPNFPDMPIVYASDAFLSLTGYCRDEVLGQNCRFLNGPGTDIQALQEIHESVRAARACTVRLLSYRKDKSSFWNLLHVSPVRNATGKIAFYVGVHIIESCRDAHGLTPEMRQLSTVAQVKVAVRSLSSGAGPSSRSLSSS